MTHSILGAQTGRRGAFLRMERLESHSAPSSLGFELAWLDESPSLITGPVAQLSLASELAQPTTISQNQLLPGDVPASPQDGSNTDTAMPFVSLATDQTEFGFGVRSGNIGRYSGEANKPPVITVFAAETNPGYLVTLSGKVTDDGPVHDLTVKIVGTKPPYWDLTVTTGIDGSFYKDVQCTEDDSGWASAQTWDKQGLESNPIDTPVYP